MALARFFVDPSLVMADLHSLTAASLVGCDELDAALPVPVVVLADK